MAKQSLPNTADYAVLWYHSTGLVVVYRASGNDTTLRIARSSNPQTTSFTDIGTGSTVTDCLIGAHLIGDDLHVFYTERDDTGKTPVSVSYHRVFDLSTDSWVAAATSLLSATTDFGGQTTIANACGAFSNDELVVVVHDTDGSSMGNPTPHYRFYTKTTAGSWTDRGAVKGYDNTANTAVSGLLVGNNIATCLVHTGSDMVYSQLTQSGYTTDIPSTFTDNMFDDAPDGLTNSYTGVVQDTTTDVLMWSHSTLVFHDADGTSPLGTVTEKLYAGSSVCYGMVVDPATGYLYFFHVRSGDLYYRESLIAWDINSWGGIGDDVLIYNPTGTTWSAWKGGASKNTRTDGGGAVYAAVVANDPDNSGSYIYEAAIVASTGTTVTPSTATLSFTGYAPTVEVAQSAAVTPQSVTVSLTGYAPSASVATTVTPQTATVSLTGYTPSVDLAASLAPQAATVSLTAYAPSADLAASVAPSAASVALAGYAPTVLYGTTLSPQTATVSFTGYTPTVDLAASVTASAATVSLTGYAPTVSAGAGVAVIPQAATLSFTGYVPSVNLAASVAPQTATASYTAYAPSVVVDTSVSAQPSTATLSLASFAPVVSATADVSVTPYTTPFYVSADGNRARFSEDFSQAAWSPSGTILANNAVSPFGSKTAETFTTSSAQISQSHFVGTNGNARPLLWSLYVGKSTTGNGDCRLSAFTQGGTSATTAAQFDRQTGTFFGLSGQASTGTEGVDYGKVDVNSDWWRIWVRLDFNADNTHVVTGFQSNWSGGVENTNVWGAQRTYDYLPVPYSGPTGDDAQSAGLPIRPLVLVDTPITPQTATVSLAGNTPAVDLAAFLTPQAADGGVALVAYGPIVALAASLSPNTATVSIAGYAPSVALAASLVPQATTVSITAYAPTVVAVTAASVTPQTATVSLGTYAPTADLAASLQPVAATVSLTAFAPTASTTANVSVEPQVATVSLTGETPVVDLAASVVPQTAVVSLTTYAAFVSFAGTAIPQTATVSIVGYAPVVALSAALTPQTATVSIVGYVPAVAFTANVSTSPTTAALTLTAYAPTANLSASLVPQTATLSLAGYAPVVASTASVSVTPIAASLTLVSYAPSVALSASVTPVAASIQLSGNSVVVSISASVSVTPSTATLSLTAYAPTVVAAASVAVSPVAATIAIVTYAPTVVIGGDFLRWMLFESAHWYLDDGTINIGSHTFKARALDGTYALDILGDAVLADLTGATGTDQTITLSQSGSWVSSASDVTWPDASNVRFVAVYDDTATNDELLAIVDFGYVTSVPAGFSLTLPSGNMYWR